MAQAHSGPAVPPQSTGARDSTGQLPSRRGFSAQNTYSLPPPVLPVSSLEPGNIYTQNREWNFERQDLARTWNWTPDSRTSPELILGRETFGNYRSVTKWPYPGPLKPAPTLPPPTGHLLMAARGTARRSMSTRHSVPTPFSGGTGIRQQSPMAMTAHSQMSIAHPQPILKKQGIKGLLVKGVPSDRSIGVDVPVALQDPKWRQFYAFIRSPQEAKKMMSDHVLRHPKMHSHNAEPCFRYTQRQMRPPSLPALDGEGSVGPQQVPYEMTGGWSPARRSFYRGKHVMDPNTGWVPNFLTPM